MKSGNFARVPKSLSGPSSSRCTAQCTDLARLIPDARSTCVPIARSTLARKKPRRHEMSTQAYNRRSDSCRSDPQRSDSGRSDPRRSDLRRLSSRRSNSHLSDSRLSDSRLSDSRLSDSRLSDSRLLRVAGLRVAGLRLAQALRAGVLSARGDGGVTASTGHVASTLF